MHMKKFIVTWASRYNGVHVGPNWDSIPEDEVAAIDAVVDQISDDAEELAGYTAEAAGHRWEEMSDEQIVELKRRALAFVNKYLPNITLDEVGYEEDPYSS
jgi:hypothetical protein